MHHATNKLPCECKPRRVEQVQDGIWECSRVECPHRSHNVAFPDHAKSNGDGTYRINATDKAD